MCPIVLALSLSAVPLPAEIPTPVNAPVTPIQGPSPGSRTPSQHHLAGTFNATRVLLLPFTQPVHPDLGNYILHAIKNHLVASPHYEVVTADSLNAALMRERLADEVGCSSDACLGNLSQLAQVDVVLLGTVTSKDTQHRLTLTLMHPSSGAVLETGTVSTSGGPVMLGELGGKLAMRLVRREPDPASTFMTLELSSLWGVPSHPNAYSLGTGGALQLAFGGKFEPWGVYFHLLGGVEGFYAWGQGNTVLHPELSHNRFQISATAGLRVALPVALDDALRLYLRLGGGVMGEHYTVYTPQRHLSSGWGVFGALRSGVGVWLKLTRKHSLLVGYNLQVRFAGEGLDPPSEYHQHHASPQALATHQGEIGWALHF